MTTAHEWATYIKIFSGLIIIGGIIGIISSFVYAGGITLNWGSFVLGVMYVAVGSRGMHAATHHCAKDARQYFRGLISLILVLVIINIIGITFNSITGIDQICEDDNIEANDCNNIRAYYLIASLVGLFFAVVCCSSCAWCARAYYHALLHEEQAQFAQPGFGAHQPYNAGVTSTYTFAQPQAQAQVYYQPQYQPATQQPQQSQYTPQQPQQPQYYQPQPPQSTGYHQV
jgi:hypothetical protein